jgi:hypothetical protein
MATTSGDVLFEEHQQFRQAWLWGVLLGVCAVAGCAVLAAVMGGGSPWVVLVLLPPAGLVWLLYALDMRVRVDGEALFIRFAPLARKQIPLATIASCELSTYRPLVEYGGWGVRYSLSG